MTTLNVLRARRPGRWRRLGMVIVTAAAIAVAAGCSSGGGSVQSASLEETSITVGAVPTVDTAGLYVAQQRGYFAAEGLHVKIDTVASSELAISRQLAGTYDITFGGYVSYIQEDAEQNASLRIIAEGSVMGPGEEGLLVMPGSPITTLAKLKQATIAVNAVNNVGAILIGSALESVGLSSSSVKFVQVPFQNMAAALRGHQVDAAWMPEPFVSATEEQLGATDISDLDFGGMAGFPLAGYAATGAWIQKHPGTEAAFLRALDKGQQVADTDRAAVEQAMQSFMGVTPLTAAAMSLPQFPVAGVNQVRMQRTADAMQQFGLLKKPFKVTPFVS